MSYNPSNVPTSKLLKGCSFLDQDEVLEPYVENYEVPRCIPTLYLWFKISDKDPGRWTPNGFGTGKNVTYCTDLTRDQLREARFPMYSKVLDANCDI